MCVRGENLAVIVHSSRLVARLFAGLRQQRKDQWIALVGLLQIGDRGLVVSRVEGNVADEIRIKARLLWIVSFIEGGFSGNHMFLSFIVLTTPGSDAGLGVLPPENPQILLGFTQARLLKCCFIARFVPLVGILGITGFEINASE